MSKTRERSRGQSTNPAVLVRATGRGFGYIHAAIGTAESRALQRDSTQTLRVRIL